MSRYWCSWSWDGDPRETTRREGRGICHWCSRKEKTWRQQVLHLQWDKCVYLVRVYGIEKMSQLALGITGKAKENEYFNSNIKVVAASHVLDNSLIYDEQKWKDIISSHFVNYFICRTEVTEHNWIILSSIRVCTRPFNLQPWFLAGIQCIYS